MFFIQTCFSSVQLRSFLYLDTHVDQAAQLIIPLGLNCTTFQILLQVSSSNGLQYVCHILKTQDFRSWGNYQTENHKINHLFHHDVSISSNSPSVGTPCGFKSCNSHVFTQSFNLTLLPCFQSTSVYQYSCVKQTLSVVQSTS